MFRCNWFDLFSYLFNRQNAWIDSSKDVRDIVCFNILQIGELAKHLPSSFIDNHSGVPWKNIKGMRDWVVHGYGTIDFDTIWKTAVEDIKPLREYCESILETNT